MVRGYDSPLGHAGVLSSLSAALQRRSADRSRSSGSSGVLRGHDTTLQSATACSGGDWFFRGRPNGNAGPGRTLRRDSRTARIAASVDGDLQAFGGRDVHIDLGLSYSHARGNLNVPGIYTRAALLALPRLRRPGLRGRRHARPWFRRRDGARRLHARAADGVLTLLYAAKDPTHNHAIVLRDRLIELAKG